MKRIISFLLFAVASFCASAEQVSIVVGATKSIQTPFVVESYRLIPAKTDVVKIDVSESTLRIVANKIGEVTLSVSGGGIVKDYTISVKSNLARILKKLRADLDELTELEVSVNEDQIIVRGTVSNPDNWAHLMQVLKYYDGVANFARFKVAPQTLINLKKMLAEAGFVFAPEGTKAEPGQLTMSVSSDTVIITGELYSESDANRIRQVLASQTWLSIGSKPSANSGKVYGIVNLTVIETVLAVDVVYAGITASEADNIGSGGIPALSLGASVLYDMIKGSASGNKSAMIGGNMGQTVQFLAKNGVTRFYSAGHVSFNNNDKEGGKLHTGSTIYVKVNGVENGSLQNIDYGLKINVSGGLVSPTKTRLKLELENSTLISADEESYSIEKDTTSQTVFCDLDKTVILAGSKKIGQDTRRSGLPVLRNTPVLKWFFGSDVDSQDEVRLLILACPRLAKYNAEAQIEIPIEKETSPTFTEAKIDNNERNEKRKKYSGVMYWMNWFVW